MANMTETLVRPQQFFERPSLPVTTLSNYLAGFEVGPFRGRSLQVAWRRTWPARDIADESYLYASHVGISLHVGLLDAGPRSPGYDRICEASISLARCLFLVAYTVTTADDSCGAALSPAKANITTSVRAIRPVATARFYLSHEDV